MLRKFVYDAAATEIRKYVEQLGFETVDNYSRDGQEIIGFSVVDTTVSLNYDIKLGDDTLGQGMISLHDSRLVPDPNNSHNSIIDADATRYAKSLKLYQKLYRRFRDRSGSFTN